MAEITEVFEDFTENTKKLVKSKPFLIALAVVIVLALFAAVRKNKAEDTSEAGPYEAIGYAGYPTVGGGGGEYSQGEDTSSYYESIIADYERTIQNMKSDYEQTILDMQTNADQNVSDLKSHYDSSMDELYSNINDLSNAQKDQADALAETNYQLQRERAISQMKANSELYNVLSKPEDASRREALHAENMRIAEEMGWEFDSHTGNYFEGDSILYTVSWQDAKGAAPSGTSLKSGVSKATSSIGSALKSTANKTPSYTNNATATTNRVNQASKDSSRSGKTVQVKSDGNAPSGTNVGDRVVTKGGTYEVVKAGTSGASYNPSSGLWSKKVSD